MGHHADVSIGLKLEDTFNSLDFLKGHAGKNDNGTYEMVRSDFLNSFVGKMISKDKVFLNNLLNQDWDWVDDYIKVTRWIDSFRKRLSHLILVKKPFYASRLTFLRRHQAV